MSSSNETRTLIELMYKNFPKCPICDHEYTYYFSWKANETYATCRLCRNRWLLELKNGELVISKFSTKTRLKDIVTVLGLALLSGGVFTAFLFNALLGMVFVTGGIVIAVMGVAFPPIKRIKEEKLEKEIKETHPCPQCHKEISKNFKLCPYCRLDLKSRTGLSTCPSCGKKISSRFKLCPYCRKRTDVNV